MSSPLILNCPLCCDETFTSHSSLKYHLLSIIDNIICPACNKRFDKLMELVVHLENECAEEEEEEIFEDPFLKVEGNEDCVETTIEEDLDEEASNNDNISENAEEENTQYFCQVCSVYFQDIELHLQEFHEGQELMLESENENMAADEDEVFEESEMKLLRIDSPQIISTEEADSVEPNETSKEKDILDRHGHTYMRKLMKTCDADEIKKNKKQPPIIENYISINGETILISPEDVKHSADVVIIYKCPSCSAESSSVMDYVKHDCDTKTTSHECDICDAIFLSNKALSNHKRKHYRIKKKVEVAATHKTEENMVCDVCGTEFPSFKSLLLHKRMHNPIKSQTLVAAPVSYGPAETTKSKSSETFECTICDKSYNINYKDVHMKSHKEGDTFICPVCNKKFFTKLNLEMHSKAHNSDKKFCCSYCKKTFLTQDSMNEHVLTQCQMKKYECKFCGRRFGKPHEKVKHERIHTGSKPYVCDICGKAFRVSYCLTLHTRTHTGLRPYQCQHCGKRFKSHSVYNHHLLTHSDVRAYKCPFCPKAFKTNVQLAGHKNSHTKPFLCTECNRPFASLYAVRGHMDTHKRLNNLKYDCSVCGAIYARLFALKDHMKAQHGKDLVSDTGELVDRQVDAKKKASILKTDARKTNK